MNPVRVPTPSIPPQRLSALRRRGSRGKRVAKTGTQLGVETGTGSRNRDLVSFSRSALTESSCVPRPRFGPPCAEAVAHGFADVPLWHPAPGLTRAVRSAHLGRVVTVQDGAVVHRHYRAVRSVRPPADETIGASMNKSYPIHSRLNSSPARWMPSATFFQAVLRSGQRVTGLPSLGRASSFPNRESFQTQSRRINGITRAVPWL